MIIQFEPLQELFEEASPVPPDLMKKAVVEDFKEKSLTGVPEIQLEIIFQPEDGSDILIRKVDPEKALGYNTFANENEYFNKLQDDMYIPEAEI